LQNIGQLGQVYAALNFRENGQRVLRAGIHATLGSTNADQMPGLRALAGDNLHLAIDTAANFGVAVANPGFAIRDRQLAESVVQEYGDESIILASNPFRCGPAEVCGSLFGAVNLDFDGQILTDAHARFSRGVIGHFQDWSIGMAALLSRLLATVYYESTGSQMFCPIRDGPSAYPGFVERLLPVERVHSFPTREADRLLATWDPGVLFPLLRFRDGRAPLPNELAQLLAGGGNASDNVQIG